jgi:hypothetical protein
MATVSHTIYSHSKAPQRKSLATLPSHARGESPDPWETESPFPARMSLEAPRFVPATISDEDARYRQPADNLGGDVGTELAGWYRSLASPQGTVSGASPNARSSTIERPSNPPMATQGSVQKGRTEVMDKNNWFIRRAIESAPSAQSNLSSIHTIADMLARDPPPIGGGYSPPAWLALGPSNKGFTMLQRNGWNEGEGLGPRGRRRARIGGNFIDSIEYKEQKKPRFQEQPVTAKGTQGVKWEEGVQEIQHIDVIDLTVSGVEEWFHESDTNEDTQEGPFSHPQNQSDASFNSAASPHSPKALLTPIATVLKSDRLGIGLKAKTVGPHKASQKRITHGAAALAAHIKAAEDTRKQKATRGRGHRGFARMAKKEQERRKNMLAYLNE